MKRNKGKLVLILSVFIITIGANTYAHSGRTDSSGGHRDNKNKSGLGSYHYHCGGYPAHLHTNGICPYSSKKSTTSSSNKTTTKKTTTIEASSVNINQRIETMEIGESKTLTATVIPNNATDKSIKWNTSDDSIITINSDGKIMAKRDGNVDITATTSNGKTNTIRIEVKSKEEKVILYSNIPDLNIATKNMVNNGKVNINNTNNNIIGQSDTNEINQVGILVALSALGAVGYWIYKKRI